MTFRPLQPGGPITYEGLGFNMGDDPYYGFGQNTDPNAAGYTTAAPIDPTNVTQQLQSLASQYGVTYDPSDTEDVLRSYYNSGGGSLDTALQMAEQKYVERGGGGLTDLMRTVQGSSGGGGSVDLSGRNPGETFEVQGANLTPSIDSTLLRLMDQGMGDELGLTDRLSALLDRTAGGGVNSDRLRMRQEAAREALTMGEETALADLRADLANRGLISMPGAPEGSELDATVRAFTPLHRAYLAELRGAQYDESRAADDLELDALTRATGWTRDQAMTQLGAAQTAQQRQQILSNIALGVLDRNIVWNQFLADFGLRRETLAQEISSGRLENILPILGLFMQLFGGVRQGSV